MSSVPIVSQEQMRSAQQGLRAVLAWWATHPEASSAEVYLEWETNAARSQERIPPEVLSFRTLGADNRKALGALFRTTAEYRRNLNENPTPREAEVEARLWEYALAIDPDGTRAFTAEDGVRSVARLAELWSDLNRKDERALSLYMEYFLPSGRIQTGDNTAALRILREELTITAETPDSQGELVRRCMLCRRLMAKGYAWSWIQQSLAVGEARLVNLNYAGTHPGE